MSFLTTLWLQLHATHNSNCGLMVALTMVWWLPRFELSKWGLMSFGLMVVANLWGFQNGDLRALGLIVANLWGFQNGGTYELQFDCCQLMYELSKWGGLTSFGLMVANLWASKMATHEQQQQRAQFQKPPPYHKRIKEHETNPTMTTVWWNISPPLYI